MSRDRVEIKTERSNGACPDDTMPRIFFLFYFSRKFLTVGKISLRIFRLKFDENLEGNFIIKHSSAQTISQEKRRSCLYPYQIKKK